MGTDRITKTWYAGSFVYNGSSLNFITNSEGMYLPGGNYQYFLKDHLGNTRLVVNTSGTGGTIVQQTDYYPFGMDIANYNGGLDNKYRYNGKELQTDLINGKNLDWYDYGARFYDPAIGRWHSPEPYAELAPGISVYAYCYNNPINYTEPDGRWPGWVHARIIRKALNPYIGTGFTVEQLDQIIKGGDFIDRYFQDSKYSYMHSMRNGLTNQSILGAMAAREEWVSNNIAIFKASGGKDFQSLGFAIHAMSDQYAPPHSWEPWYGQSKWNPSAWYHGLRELNPFGKFSNSFKLSEILVNQTYERATEPESKSSSTTSAPVSPRPVDPPIDPINPIPWTPTPAPAPSPMPIPQPQPPVPLPPLR